MIRPGDQVPEPPSYRSIMDKIKGGAALTEREFRMIERHVAQMSHQAEMELAGRAMREQMAHDLPGMIFGRSVQERPAEPTLRLSRDVPLQPLSKNQMMLWYELHTGQTPFHH